MTQLHTLHPAASEVLEDAELRTNGRRVKLAHDHRHLLAEEIGFHPQGKDAYEQALLAGIIARAKFELSRKSSMQSRLVED